MTKSNKVSDDAEPRGNPRGVSRSTTMAKTNLAIAVRQNIPAEIMVEFQLAILQGQNPRLVKDARYHHGWRIEDTCTEQGGIAPTLQDKNGAWKALTERGWGMPAQTIHLEHDVRAQLEISSAALPPNALQGQRLDTLLGLRALLAQPKGLIEAARTRPPEPVEEIEDAEVVGEAGVEVGVEATQNEPG